ncbi:MAG: GIDE domain-containing protein [Pseudomonadales bacterium]
MNLLFIVIPAVIAAISLYTAFTLLIKARSIEDTPSSKIRSAHQGYVELNGQAQAADLPFILAPLTNTQCLWYSYSIERYEVDGKRKNWKTIKKGTSDLFFTLSDETGDCLIDPQGADISATKQRWYGNAPHPIGSTAEPAGFLSRIGGRQYRYTEERIHSGDWLFSLGMLQTIHAPSHEAQKQQQLQLILTEWKTDHQALLDRFDGDQNGNIDQQEWESARQEASAEAHYKVLQNQDDTPVNILGQTPNRRQPYIVSTSDPIALVRKYRHKGILLLLSAILCGGLTISQLL